MLKNKSVKITLGLVLILGIVFAIFALTDKKKDNTVPTVGVLQFVSHPALDTIYDGLLSQLEARGYSEEAKSIKINFQNAQADQSKLNIMSQQLIQDKSEILVGLTTLDAKALANETTELPIVMGAVSDPVSAGLVDSIEKPGRNITGVSDRFPMAPQVDLIKSILPEAKTMGILYSVNEDNSDFQAKEMEKVATDLGFAVKLYGVSSTNDLKTIVLSMKDDIDFIYIPMDNTIANAMETVVDAANANNMPIFPSVDTMLDQGGVACVTINQRKLGEKAGDIVADIIEKKSVPATTPVFIFDTVEVLVNEAQAEKLGITIPAEYLNK